MKSFLLTLLLVSITTLSFSQEPAVETAKESAKDADKKSTIEDTPEIKWGVRGGINISNLDFSPDPTFENKHRNGFAFGAFVDYGFSESFSILAELQYSAEGAEAETLRADYIQLPILFRFCLGEFLTVGAGPMASLKTWGHNDGFSTFTFSGVAGLEYMITDELFIDARVHYGFTNILDEDLTTQEAKPTTIQFGFGLKI